MARYLGPQLPASQVLSDQLMVLEQVKNNPSAKTGDRGIIGTIGPKPVKLQFLSDDAKRQVLDIHDNPFQCVFVVNVEVRSVQGKPMLYRIFEVTDVMKKDE